MNKKSIKKVIKPSCLISILLLIIYCVHSVSFVTTAQTVSTLPSCVGQKCFSNLTDVTVSSDGSFSLILDSSTNSYIEKVNFLNGMVTTATLIPLDEININTDTLKIDISDDNKKAFVFNAEPTKISSSSSGETGFFRFSKESNLFAQVDQGTTCKCGSSSYFDNKAQICVAGTLDCSNTPQDSVCSCDNLGFLNSCVLMANGYKLFTKGDCGSTSNLSCTVDSQCPIATCPDGTTYNRFSCTSTMCTLITFSTDPCLIASTTIPDCKCPSGTYFDEMTCVTGTLDCSNTPNDTVCSCDNLNFINSCAARASGYKKFTKGGCGSEGNLVCTNDSQCPLGTCSNGDEYKKSTCINNKCKLITFSIDPCPIVIRDCKCSQGTRFDGMSCVTSSGAPDCRKVPEDHVCSCDNFNYLNSCIAQTNGVKRFIKGDCGSENSNIGCTSDSQCPPAQCSDGTKYKIYSCKSGECKKLSFSLDPCLSSSGGFSSSTYRLIDLTNNSVKTITPVRTTKTSVTKESISTGSFLDSTGKTLIASNDNEDDPKILVIDNETGEIIKRPKSLPGIPKSIELSPTFRKAVVTFKNDFAQTLGILETKTRDLKQFDTPTSIIFKIDEFLSMVDFSLQGDKAVVSSLDGNHVLHLLNLKENKLIIRFLNNKTRGKTLSTINSDGTTAISAGDNKGNTGITVYKINTSNLRRPRIIKSQEINDGSRVLDVLITPDNALIFILVEKESKKKLKILNINDLSELCEFVVSNDIESTFLISDPVGRFFLTPNFKDDTVSFISDLQVGPVFKSISPDVASKNGGTDFIIDGYVDPSIFTNNVKVCFGNNTQACATSVAISSDGRAIRGVTPPFPTASLTSISIIAEKKPSTSSSSPNSSKCLIQVNTKSTYKEVFEFE